MKDISFYCDNTLIKRIQKDRDCESTTEIMRRHSNIVFSVINKFCRRNPYIKKEDLMDDKYSIFYQAIRTYKSNKGAKFSSWLYIQTRFHILNNYKNADKTYSVENKTIDDINNQNNIFQLCGQNNKDNLDFVRNLLDQMEDKRIKKIFKMRYFDGRGNKLKDWKSIGEEIGLSITRVISLHKQGTEMLLKKINSVDKSDII